MLPAERINRAKERFSLSLARMRQGNLELGLLSLQGCVEDSLRAVLVLHGDASAELGSWADLLASLTPETPSLSITPPELHQLRQLTIMQQRIVVGDAVTLTLEALVAYQHIVAQVLVRNQITVIIPSEEPTYTRPTPTAHMDYDPAHARRRARMMFGGVLLIAALLGFGSGFFASSAWIPQSSPISRTQPGRDPIATPVPTPLSSFRVGVTALVSADTIVRDHPSRIDNGDDTVATLSANSAVEIIDGPALSENIRWWRVRVAGREGWCEESFLKPQS